jgi:threonine dehydrogenase-like Zn-dependent dehydrogenase
MLRASGQDGVMRDAGGAGLPSLTCLTRVTADHGVTLRVAATGAVRPARLVTRVIGLDDGPEALAAMSAGSTPGVTVIRPAAGV